MQLKLAHISSFICASVLAGISLKKGHGGVHPVRSGYANVAPTTQLPAIDFCQPNSNWKPFPFPFPFSISIHSSIHRKQSEAWKTTRAEHELPINSNVNAICYMYIYATGYTIVGSPPRQHESITSKLNLGGWRCIRVNGSLADSSVRKLLTNPLWFSTYPLFTRFSRAWEWETSAFIGF